MVRVALFATEAEVTLPSLVTVTFQRVSGAKGKRKNAWKASWAEGSNWLSKVSAWE